MAVKIKKKRPDAPVEETDELLAEEDTVLHASRETFDFLQDNRTAVLSGIAILVVGIIAGSLMVDQRAAASAEAASGLFAALAETNESVGEEGTYADVPARAAAVETSAQQVVAEHPEDALGTTARLLVAHGALLQGEAGTAQQQFAAFRTARSGSPEANVAAFGEAAAMAAAGDLDGAIGLLDSLDGGNEAMAFGAGLQKARLIDTFGTPNAALDAYRAVIADHPDRSAQAFVEHRATQLEIELNVEPVAAEVEGEETGDE